jgi:hypothetical protein
VTESQREGDACILQGSVILPQLDQLSIPSHSLTLDRTHLGFSSVVATDMHMVVVLRNNQPIYSGYSGTRSLVQVVIQWDHEYETHNLSSLGSLDGARPGCNAVW